MRKKIEEIKAQQKDSNVDQHTAEGPLDGSFSGYSPIPSRKKSSLKKRNRKSKSPKGSSLVLDVQVGHVTFVVVLNLETVQSFFGEFGGD